MLHVRNLTFSFDEKIVLNDFNPDVKKGEICCLIGASGSGKTTLFNLISNALTPQEGSVSLEGEVSYVTQQDLLLPWRNVINNMLLPHELKGRVSNETKQKARKLLESLGLKRCENLYPHELSQGMRQRVSLATTLFQQNPMLLLDEPFASLDVALRERLYHMLREIRTQQNTTILMTTHDFRDALTLADTIALLANGSVQKMWAITEEIRENPLQHYQTFRNYFFCENLFS